MTSKSVFYRVGSDMWFLGFFSNNFQDVEGETFTKDSHDEYAAWLKETGVTPPITVLHQPHYDDAVHITHYLSLVRGDITPQEFSANLKILYKPVAIADTKLVIPVDGFNLVVGKVYDNKRELVERLMQRSDKWGMSHGFVVLKSNDAVIEKYRSFEFSILPEELAANRVTTISFLERDINMQAELKRVNDEDRQLLRQLLDDSVDPNEIELAVEKAKTILAGILGSKSLDEIEETMEEQTDVVEVEETVVEEVAETTEEKAVDYETVRAQLVEDLKVKELAETLTAIGERLETLETALDSVVNKIDTQEKQVEALQKSDDEKVAAVFEAPDWSFGLARRSVTNTKNVVQEEELLEELKENIPAEIDEKTKQDNPLYLGLYSNFS